MRRRIRRSRGARAGSGCDGTSPVAVRRIRLEKKLTLEDVAHRAQMHWQKIEAGEVSAEALRTLARLSAALGVEPRQLLE